MESYDILIKILEASVKKNGEIVLTNKHLLNILKLAEKEMERLSEESDKYGFDPNYD